MRRWLSKQPLSYIYHKIVIKVLKYNGKDKQR